MLLSCLNPCAVNKQGEMMTISYGMQLNSPQLKCDPSQSKVVPGTLQQLGLTSCLRQGCGVRLQDTQ